MSEVSCYLSCSGTGVCFYDSTLPHPSTSNTSSMASQSATSSVKYCCADSSLYYCCNDVSFAVKVRSSDNAPSECYGTPWTAWRSLSLTLGVISVILISFVFCHAAKRFHQVRQLRRLQQQQRTASAVESRRSSVSSVDNSPPITIDGLLSSSYLAAFRAHIDNSATTSTSSNQLILPPSYDSLQPVPTDYDKSLPPNYYEVVELSLANSAATVAIQPPFIQPPVPVTAADSGLTSSEVAVSTLAPAENASPDAMTATRDRDNDASEQRQDDVPEDAVISCDVDDDNNGDGGKVNHAIDLTDEVEVTCRDNNRQTPDVDTPPTTVFQEVASVMEVDVDGRTLANSQS